MVGSNRIFPRVGRLLSAGSSGAERSGLSGEPVDQACGIQQRCCLIEELLGVEDDAHRPGFNSNTYWSVMRYRLVRRGICHQVYPYEHGQFWILGQSFVAVQDAVRRNIYRRN